MSGGLLHRFLASLLVVGNTLRIAVFPTKQLHTARFARFDELMGLLSTHLDETSLLLGVKHFKHVLRVRPLSTRRELGNVLIVAPTRGGKGLLATSQLLSWQHSVIVNDIKGDLYQQTAGYRSTLGPVYVIDQPE